MKKEIKSRLFDYTCPNCGWKASRGSRLFSPSCSLCGSEEPPVITEREVVKEVESYQTYSEDELADAKRIADEIQSGKPLEEIEGIYLGDEDLRQSARACGNTVRVKHFSHLYPCRGSVPIRCIAKFSPEVFIDYADCCCRRFEDPIAEEDPTHDYY